LSRRLFTCQGGHVLLPERSLALVGREDGGNLIVTPPREVWERSELTRLELVLWSFLVAATARAMLDVLPQLAGGCINYWEAGNWALNDEAEPKGPKLAQGYRRVHLHLLGRSRTAQDPSWLWGEAPRFPAFAERQAWAANYELLNAEECREIVAQTEASLVARYEMNASQITPGFNCPLCGYPTPIVRGQAESVCADCQYTS
jgi:NADH pyrophosphatase NudC (nudix superfamily)